MQMTTISTPMLKSLTLNRMLNLNTVNAQGLTELTIDKSLKVANFEFLAGLTNLKTLTIIKSAIKDEELKFISPTVTKLTISHTDSIIGHGFAHLTNHPLTTLIVPSNVNLTDAMFDHLPVTIQYLHINAHKSKLSAFEKISRLTELNKLLLVRVPEITDDQVIAICNACTKLRYLVINSGIYKKNQNLSNNCMKAMGNLMFLKHVELNFFGDKFTDKGVKQLERIKSLRVLDLKRSGKLTAKCYEYLPYTTVTFGSSVARNN